MVMCWAPECKHYNQRETCMFFKFPTDLKKRMKWKKLVRRAEEPGPGARLCSYHFPDGKKENGPQLFEHNKSKRLTFSSPEKRARRSLTAYFNELTSNIAGTAAVDPESVGTKHTGIASAETLDLYIDPQPSTSTGISGARQPSALSGPISSSPSKVVLHAENYFLRSQIEKDAITKTSFSYKEIFHSNSLVTLYTGLPNAEVFNSLFQLVENIKISYYLQWNVEKICKEDQLFMCLIKLRLNFPHEDLAFRFGVSQATVTNIVITWIHVLHEVLYKQLMCKIPSRNKNRTCLPNCFRTFTNCRIIIDCTEMATIVPRQSMKTQKATYSPYKHRNTWKVLIGVAPNGVITYVSELYPGSTSDKKIVQHCKILDQMESGDLILADKGFLLKDILPPGVNLNTPPFLMTPQFTPEQVFRTESIARARIHIERAFRRMKNFKILNFIPYSLQKYASYVIQVIGALTNLQPLLIKEVESAYSSSESEKTSE